MAARVGSFDWAATTSARELVPSLASWSDGPRIALSHGLRWGPDLVFVYNDGLSPILGTRHPARWACVSRGLARGAGAARRAA